MFDPVAASTSFPQLEERVIEFWRQQGIYEKSLDRRRAAAAPRFVFYEGPPTANGLPHPGHCLTRAIKDLFPRYRTMRGYLCERKAGWDTHGLPVEVEVCKELGIHSKEEIEAFGVEPFIHRCIESVFRYTREWERLTERLGFWIRMDEAYVTYHQSFIESVWWALKNLFDRGLLYQGHKIVWWWAQGGTALSSGEVGQGYREVADPSVYVRFPLVAGQAVQAADGAKLKLDDADLLVWTTTPWTLPSNQFAAVHPELEYAVVRVEGEPRRLVVAAALVEQLAQKSKRELTVDATLPGSALVGVRYQPPFDYYYAKTGDQQGRLRAGGRQHVAWRVVPATFVTIDTGTGVVHQAPAFGEVDFQVLASEQARFEPGEGPELICAVGPDGRFTSESPDYAGRWVKEADKDISRALKQRGLLLHQEQYLHDYPFCWRAEDDPLIQYPRRSWFIRTSNFKEAMLANNARINWLPEHIRDGRFGNFLETNVDWALSRERYWGTPLPIWVCDQSGRMEAVASYAELVAKPGLQGTEVWEEAKRSQPKLSEDLKIHKPYIDAVTYDSPFAAGARMRRVGEVIDCWFDSGAMPFAQWGYPAQPRSRERFEQQFPADFISEAIDQTRGWFYSQLAISTLLFGDGEQDGSSSADANSGATAGLSSSASADAAPHEYPHPFRNCIVLGLMLGEDGQKMSKSKRNYREPAEIFDRYGADALRWYFFANQPPWTSIRYNEASIKESIPEFLLRLWNVYSFFVIYANIDKFDPAERLAGDVADLSSGDLARGKGYRPARERSELDRWMLAELNATAAAVVASMDAYDNYAACQRITAFVDALSNWYVRQSRGRFWAGEITADKLDAYWTLYECLTTAARLVAPFVPFLAESLWQNLVAKPFGQRALESVHLADYPTGDVGALDADLSRRMNLVREIVSLGRSARMSAKLKVRQPLRKVEVILVSAADQPWLEAHAALIAAELNVKQVEFTREAEHYISYTVLPDLKRLGPRLGKSLPALKQALAAADPAALLAQLSATGRATVELPTGPVELDRDDLQVRLSAKPGWAAADGPAAVVVLSTEIDESLLREGLAREVVHAIQTRRKEIGCEYTDRIRISITTDSDELRRAVEDFRDYIAQETLAVDIALRPEPAGGATELDLGGHRAMVAVENVRGT
ncbi:MAG: isoleucine--tRNA ligase [Pirellulales bacterium]|nr:isoleucine--tRNA ligase [Pirellulales bacterium]